MTALLSECGKYRYSLERLTRGPVAWPEPFRTVMWVMLNPSTADAREDDQTIRKCTAFSARWGFDRLLVANLFAWRSTDPRKMAKEQRNGTDILGPCTNEVMLDLAQRAELVVCAWGAWAELWPKRAEWVANELLKVTPVLMALKFTNSGQPYHPLYLPLETELQPWVR